MSTLANSLRHSSVEPAASNPLAGKPSARSVPCHVACLRLLLFTLLTAASAYRPRDMSALAALYPPDGCPCRTLELALPSVAESSVVEGVPTMRIGLGSPQPCGHASVHRPATVPNARPGSLVARTL